MAITVTKNLMQESWEDGDNVIAVRTVPTPDHYGVAESEMSDSITFTLDTLDYIPLSDGTLAVKQVKQGTLTPEKLTIPTEYKGSKVTEIYMGAFSNNNVIKEINIPVSIRRIGAQAFANAAIEKVTFEDTHLYTVYFQCPDGWGVPDVDYGYGSEGVIDGGTMQLVDANQSIYSFLVPQDVGSIRFYSEDKSEETYLYTLADGQILNCLFTVHIQKIGSNSFNVIEPTANYIPENGFSGLGGLQIGYDAFTGCTNLTSVTLPQRTTLLDDGAFSGCTSLTTVSFTQNHRISAIGGHAFCDCTALEVVNMYDGIREIGYEAFLRCAKLSSCILGDGLQIIGLGAFSQCAKLRDIVIPSSVKRIEKKAFEGRPTSDYVNGRDRWIVFEAPSTWVASETGTVPADGNGVFLWDGDSTKTPPAGATIVFNPRMLAGLSKEESNVVRNGELLSGVYHEFVWFKLEKMLTPQVSLSGNTLSMTDPLGIADAFNIYAKQPDDSYKLKCYVRVD